MANEVTIGFYYYPYGPRNIPNRRIEFREKDEIISAEISAGESHGNWEYLSYNGNWKNFSLLTENQITKGASTSEKIRLMMKAKAEGSSPIYPPDIAFSNLSIEEKRHLIQYLKPTGEWTISIRSSIVAENPFFEQINLLRFCKIEDDE